MLRIGWGSIQEHLKVRLRVSNTIVSGLDNIDHVVPKVILCIRSNVAVEPNKVVRTVFWFNLDGNRLVGPEVILTDANDLTCPGAFIYRVMCDICIIVPSINLEVLGGIEAHHANLI